TAAEEMATKAVSVLITGANRGLGLEMVKQLVEASRDVRKLFACCRDPDGPRAEVRPRFLCDSSCSSTDTRTDGRQWSQVGSVVGTGGLNLLINNAAVAVRTTMQETTPEELQHMFSTNVMGPMNIIKEFLPHLRAAAKAAIVNISSILGSIEGAKESYATYPCFSYRVSKAALNMLTLCASEELKKDEILLSVLHPGWVRTDMGGEEGEIDATESVRGLLGVMASLTEKQNGGFLDWKGRSIPW
uniref:Zgc:92161 n=1 Tax=Gasterosteus aculeatus TaxID=69293 RepID=G3P7Z6_GASAC